MKLRLHKGTVNESLKTEQEVNSLHQLKEIIKEELGIKDINNLRFRSISAELWRDWDRLMILVQVTPNSDFVIAGISDSHVY